MTPKEFQKELLKLPHISDELLAGARTLRTRYPFFQALPIIIAMGEKQRNDKHAVEALHVAAAYSSDRTLLKELLAAGSSAVFETQIRSAVAEAESSVTEREVTGIAAEEAEAVPQSQTIAESAIVADEDELSRTEDQAQQHTEAETSKIKSDDISGTETDSPAETPEPIIVPGEFAERVIAGLDELRDRMNQFSIQTSEASDSATQPEQVKNAQHSESEQPGTSKDPTDQLLEEIKAKKKRQKPESATQVEQMELIDKFISNKPGRRQSKKPTAEKTPPPVAAPEPPPPSGQDTYSENVISETLVDLLIRQGKREKAIEVLRKLIWKFPQKKALFAARIQDLSQ